jgi:hypothetical protein
VQRVGIGPRGTVCHQSIFRGLFRARGLSAASPRLLKAYDREAVAVAAADEYGRRPGLLQLQHTPFCDPRNGRNGQFALYQ